MAGLENILGLISTRQKETESAVISAAQQKANAITAKGNEAARKEYDDYMKKAAVQLEQELANAKSSVDGDMKRKLLAYKVKTVDEVIEKTLKKLDSLSADEYFAILEKLLSRKIRSGEGTLHLGERDLKWLPDSFRKSVEKLAENAGGKINISESPADIENGFILSYGLISENCSFRDIIESERDSVRDTAAKALFG